MSPLEQKISDTVTLKKRLDAIREQSPEIADALAISDEYHGLLNEIREECNPMPPQIVPMPNASYPVQTWDNHAFYQADTTCTHNLNPIPIMIDGSGITLRIVK